jgi:tetratricopeptide (TPR) repeat protein
MHFYLGECSAADAAYEDAIELARRSGRRPDREWIEWRVASQRAGETPVAEAIASCDEALAEFAASGLLSPVVEMHKAALLAMAGEFEAARDLCEATTQVAVEFGFIAELTLGMQGGDVYRLAGELDTAEGRIRTLWDRTGALGETGFRSTVGGQLAEVLAELGRDAEASAILAEVDTIISPDDFEPQSRIRWVRAMLLVRQGRMEDAVALAREAVRIVEPTEYLDHRADAHRVLGSVLAASGRRDDAESAWRTALELYDRKGDVVSAASVRTYLGS